MLFVFVLWVFVLCFLLASMQLCPHLRTIMYRGLWVMEAIRAAREMTRMAGMRKCGQPFGHGPGRAWLWLPPTHMH